MWDDEPRGGTWTRIEGPGRPLPEDRHGDGLSEYARWLAADRPPSPAPALRVLRPSEPVQDAPQASQAVHVAPGEPIPPARGYLFDAETRTVTYHSPSIGGAGKPEPVPDHVRGFRLFLKQIREALEDRASES